ATVLQNVPCAAKACHVCGSCFPAGSCTAAHLAASAPRSTGVWAVRGTPSQLGAVAGSVQVAIDDQPTVGWAGVATDKRSVSQRQALVPPPAPAPGAGAGEPAIGDDQPVAIPPGPQAPAQRARARPAPRLTHARRAQIRWPRAPARRWWGGSRTPSAVSAR